MYVAAALVRQGVGVAVVDDFTARVCVPDDLDYRPFSPPLSFGVYAVCLADRPVSRLARSFINLLGRMTGRPARTTASSCRPRLRRASGSAKACPPMRLASPWRPAVTAPTSHRRAL